MNKDSLNRNCAKDSYSFWKRKFDFCAALITLAIIWPFMLLICAVIKLESFGPAVYVHTRVGENGRPLRLYKFRTMCCDADSMIEAFTPEQKREWQKNYKLEHDPRITKVGKVLRKTSMDELPQLVNILKGELSFVGPRPITEEELAKYGNRKDKFLSITPGLTGYWQAYARNACSYERRIEMELYYVDHASFWLDAKILFATVGVVVSGKGAM